MEDFSFLQHHDNEQFSVDEGLFHEEAMELFSNESVPGFFDTKDDLEFLNWPDHTDSLQNSFGDAFDAKFDIKPDVAKYDSPILTNALTSPVPNKSEPVRKFAPCEKIVFPGDVEPLQVSSSIQTDSLLRRITKARSVLINGEKEIFGKNIIGLHCLNEITTSPDKNCQITSTVINGKKYNIIIKPKSSAITSHSNEPPFPPPIKVEPQDEIITDLQDGDYDVLGQEDVEDPWALPLTHDDDVTEEPAEPSVQIPPPQPPRVPPLRIKIPKPKKSKKHKKRSVAGKVNAASSSAGSDKNRPSSILLRPSVTAQIKSPDSPASLDSSPQSEDSIPLDHDYCSNKRRQKTSPKTEEILMEKNPRKDSGLESGGVSDASEESPASSNPESPAGMEVVSTAPILAKELTSKLLEESRRPKNHSHVTKMAAALFRASNAAVCGAKMPAVVCEPSSTPPVAPAVPQSDCDSTNEPTTEIVTAQPIINERPKKKLKLEEYLNRRNDRENENVATTTTPANLVAKDITNEPEQDPGPMEVLEEGEVPSDISRSEDVVVVEVKRSSPEKSTQEKRSTREVKKERPQPVDDAGRRRRSCDDVSRRAWSYGSRGSRPARRYSRISSSSSTEDRAFRRRARAGSVGREKRRRYRTRSKSSSSSRGSSSSSCSSRRRSVHSISRYRRRTRSRSRSSYRSRSRDNSRSRCLPGRRRSQASHRPVRRARSRSPIYSNREKQRQIEERRVVYVGRIAEGTTNQHLRQRFSVFGPIIDISVHFREHGDNYGFVTYAYKDDAYQAVEHGNDNPALTQYDLSFGGRRSFCKQRYADLDGMPTSYSGFNDSPLPRVHDGSFDLLLKQAKAKLHMRKDGT